MARLLIVSRSMALAMRLADQHEVIEHPVDELDGLLEGIDETTDVLVLDLGDPVLAVNTVNSLREAEHDTPVLLVSGYQPEWEQVEAQEVEGVHVVPLPITRVALLQGIAILTGEEAAITFFESDDVVLPVIPPLPELEPEDGGGAGAGANGSQPGSGAGRPVPVAGAFGPTGAGGAFGPGGAGAFGPAGAGGPAGAAPGWVPSRPVVGTGEVPAVTESDVAGVAYSTAITRPFVEEPRTGQFSYPPPPVRPPAGPTGPQRWLRGAPAEPPPPPPAVPNGTGANGDGRRNSLLGNRPRKLQRHPNVVAQPGSPIPPAPYTPTGMGLVTDPLGPRTDPYGFPSSALDRRLDAEAASLARPSAGDNGNSLRTADLVRLLHERAGDLYGVSDTAQVLADDVIERASADAAAILVPDGPIWRVSGGVGLRPLERRLVLEDSHWLITEIGSAGRAVLIEDTDIIRQQLSGAPLAAWRHLLAVPVPDVRAIVVLARGSEGGPFTDRDLSAVIAPVREAAALLAQAVQTRRLARVLGPLRESEPDSPTRPRSFP